MLKLFAKPLSFLTLSQGAAASRLPSTVLKHFRSYKAFSIEKYKMQEHFCDLPSSQHYANDRKSCFHKIQKLPYLEIVISSNKSPLGRINNKTDHVRPLHFALPKLRFTDLSGLSPSLPFKARRSHTAAARQVNFRYEIT